MKKIELTNSKRKAQVSKKDRGFVNFLGPWKLSVGRPFSVEFQVFMSELVLGGLTVDEIKHKNGDKLDCRRKNLKKKGSSD
jgi:hypothetical protein